MRPSFSSSSSSSPSSTPKSPYHHVIESKSISGDCLSPHSLPPTMSTSSSAASHRDFPSFGFLDRFLQTLVADDAFNSPTGLKNESASLVPRQKLEKKFRQSPWFVSSTLLENGGVLKDSSLLKNGDGVTVSEPSPILTEAMNAITYGYEDRTEWGNEVGWIYGSVTEDILTGFKMHYHGWRSVYCIPKRPAFKGSAPINRSDRLHQVLQWALGSVEIFLSKHCPSWYGYGGGLKTLERISYTNSLAYPWTDLPLYLFTGKFIVPEGLLKFVAGVDSSFTVTSKGGDDGDFSELYILKWTKLLFPPLALVVVNVIGVMAVVYNAINNGYKSWGPLFSKLFFAFWVIIHLYPFVKGMMGKQDKALTTIIVWVLILVMICSLLEKLNLMLIAREMMMRTFLEQMS